MKLFELLGEDKEKLEVPDIEVDDEICLGRFKNRKAKVTSFDTDKKDNHPIVKTTKGPVKLLKPRFPKLMNKVDEKFVQPPRTEIENTEFDDHLIPELKTKHKLNPHASKELNLMLSGKKPAALFSKEHLNIWEKFKDKFKIFVEDNDIVITLPGEEWRAKKIFQLREYFENLWNKFQPNPIPQHLLKSYHVKLGLLLGYPKEDIKKFVSISN